MKSSKTIVTVIIVGIVLLGLALACSMVLFSDDEDTPQDYTAETEMMEDPAEDELPAEEDEELSEEEEPTEEEPAQVRPSGGNDTWLVMLYQDADDEVLEEDIFIDLNEAEMIGSTQQVTVISQIDRLDGGYDGGDDFTTAKRFLIQKDDSGDLESLASEELEDLGEVDMGSKDTLVEFVVWAITNYPADKYALILSDHGAGWTGGWTDNDPTPESQMFLNQIDEALAEITAQTGIAQLEMVGFDACLMSQIDVLSAIAPYARYTVGSEETEPALGWAYAGFLGALADDPGMDGGDLSAKIVETYIVEDGRITDDEARKVFAESVFNTSRVSQEQAAEEMSGDITLTAVDLSKLDGINTALNELVMTLPDVSQKKVSQARAYAQSYTNIFDKGLAPSFIDLGHFASLLAEAYPDTPTADAANTLIEAIQGAVVAEKHGPDRPGSTGISIYFPTAKLYKSTADSDMMLHYPTVSGRFVTASLWDDFLTYHYAKEPIDADAADPSVIQAQSSASDFSRAIQASMLPKDAEVAGPGAGSVDFKDLSASAESIGVQESLTLSADLSGENVGFIYIYTAFYDEESDSYLTTDLDFVGADETQQVGGVSYPDWGEGEDLSMELDWEPILWTVSDGTNDALAAAEAETYGATAETTFYRVWGTYRIAGSQKDHDAYLRFDANGKLDSVTIFSGSEHSAAPRKINPDKGDTFTVAEEWLEFDNDPEGEYVYYAGDTVTYGAQGFSMVANEAEAGSYVIGLVVEDLDGNLYEKYIEVTVTE